MSIYLPNTSEDFESLKEFDFDLNQYYLDNNLEPSCSMTGNLNPFYGYKHTEESKKLISQSNLGKHHYPKGKPRSEETKLKMSLSTKGTKSFTMSQDQKDKLSLANVGKKLSDETKKKIAESISKAQQGKKRGPYKKKQ